MAKRRQPQLSDMEVALIKAMIATREYNRQEILIYFSRIDRPVNLGRISEIATGKKRTDVKPATRAELTAFLERSGGNTTFVQDRDPLCDAVLAELFVLKSKRPRVLDVEESDTVEFKESFNWSGRAKYARTIAGFANHKGGYILFGIADNGKIVGMPNDSLVTMDQSQITQFLNSCFQPHIYWKRKVWNFGTMLVGILWVEECTRKPAICSKTSNPLKEGDIYFRYIGETKTIGYSELTTLLDSRDRQTEQSLATRVSRIAEIGSDRVGVLDTTTGLVEGRSGSFIIDEALLDKVSFISEGRFDETEGAPALRVVGEVKSVRHGGVEVVRTEKSVITNQDMLTDFIHQNKIADPRSYIRAFVHGQALIFPTYYYIYLSGLSLAEAIKLLRDEPTPHGTHQSNLIGRIKARKGHYISPGPSTDPYKKKILNAEGIDFNTVENRIHAVRAIQAIQPENISLDPCLTVLRAALNDYERNRDSVFLAEIRYAAAHVDAAVYAGKITDM